MTPRTTKLTKRFLDLLTPAEDASDYKVFDTDVTGFGVRLRASGRRTFFVQYRNARGRTRRMTIGHFGTLTVDEARKRAKALLGVVAAGLDPLDEREEARSRSEPFEELAESYLRTLDQPGCSQRGLKESQRLVRTRLVSNFGSKPWREITHAEVQALHRRLRDKPVEANRAVSRLSTILEYGHRLAPAAAWTNPCGGISKYPERGRERFLTVAEFQRLGKALKWAEENGSISPVALSALRILILTGARLREILDLKWSEVDFERSCLRKETSKTGKKVIPVGAAVVTELRSLEKLRESEWVFPGGRQGRPLGNLWRPWKEIRARAGLHDVRLHDLRHSFASVGVGTGLSLPVVGAALGHRSPTTTQRYAHLADDPVRHGVEQTSGLIEQLLRANRKGLP